MIKVIIFIVVCTLIPIGFFQEISNSLKPVGDANIGHLPWPFQDLQGQPRRTRTRPCSKRRNNNDEENWIPSYSSRISHPLNNNDAILIPQALKNEDYNREPRSESDAAPKINEQESSNQRSSDGLAILENLNSEDDCDDISQYESQNIDSLEQKAIEIIKNCLKKKQSAIDGRSDSNVAVGDSRRSMSSSDSAKNENEYVYEPKQSNQDDEVTDAPGSDLSRTGDTDNDRHQERLFNELMAPTKRAGIVQPRNSMSNKNTRVCYACSTATNPTCWTPNNRTTIKYCRDDQHQCVMKKFGTGSTTTVIRDCAKSCTDTPIPGIEPKIVSCKLCKNDLCNAAFSINPYNLFIILLISIAKCSVF